MNPFSPASRRGPSRRALLASFAAAGAFVAGGLGRTAWGRPTSPRLVVVLLRGGLDGLELLVPHGDPHYRRQRGDLALTDGLTDLDGTFSLPPALSALAPLWAAGELLPVHAVHTAYRERSHFDAQDCLENGTADPKGVRDGWLYRALVAGGAEGRAVAFGRTVPLVLRGDETIASVNPLGESLEDDGLADAVARLWEGDALLHDALVEGLRARAMVDGEGARLGRDRSRSVEAVVDGAARLLAREDGARIATIDVPGWDTHANQRNMLDRGLSDLAAGLATLRDGMGAAWGQTVVVVATEFGRTVAPNGTGGTDHGTAGAALLLGGAVRGGRVFADWPGLSTGDLHEGRDLRPTTDLRDVLAVVLRDHLGLSEAAVAMAFPGLSPRIDGLVRG